MILDSKNTCLLTGPTQEVGESEAHTAHAPHGRLVGDTRLGKEIDRNMCLHPRPEIWVYLKKNYTKGDT